MTFSELTEEDIDAYILSGEPMDKAGSYGIQGMYAYASNASGHNVDFRIAILFGS